MESHINIDLCSNDKDLRDRFSPSSISVILKASPQLRIKEEWLFSWLLSAGPLVFVFPSLHIPLWNPFSLSLFVAAINDAINEASGLMA
jgi:hypothetical protein